MGAGLQGDSKDKSKISKLSLSVVEKQIFAQDYRVIQSEIYLHTQLIIV